MKQFRLALVTVASLGFVPSAHAILGGQTASSDPSVVGINFADLGSSVICSGVVIDPRVVLTSASCVKPAVEENAVASGVIWVGTDETSATKIPIVDARYHRLWEEGSNEHDIAVVLLAADVGVASVALNDQALPDSLVNMKVRAVGFGADRFDDDGNYFGAGTKRTVEVMVRSVAHRFMLAGDPMGNVCKGDTGAPLFFEVDGGTEKVVAIAGNTDFCSASTAKALVDAYLEDFIWPAMDAWVGACPKDDVCTTAGCRTEDPDCNPCGLEGTCMEDCPLPDWDCPADARFRAPCAEDTDCDSRHCVAAPDEPRIKFCSEACTDEIEGRVCGEGMQCADAVCIYEAPTPGSQGAPCLNGDECRSGLCHPTSFCVEECDDEGAECGDGFVCRASELAPLVCAPHPRAAGNGFCAVSHSGPAEGGSRALVILASALAAAGFAATKRSGGRRPPSA